MRPSAEKPGAGQGLLEAGLAPAGQEPRQGSIPFWEPQAQGGFTASRGLPQGRKEREEGGMGMAAAGTVAASFGICWARVPLLALRAPSLAWALWEQKSREALHLTLSLSIPWGPSSVEGAAQLLLPAHSRRGQCAGAVGDEGGRHSGRRRDMGDRTPPAPASSVALGTCLPLRTGRRRCSRLRS